VFGTSCASGRALIQRLLHRVRYLQTIHHAISLYPNSPLSIRCLRHPPPSPPSFLLRIRHRRHPPAAICRMPLMRARSRRPFTTLTPSYPQHSAPMKRRRPRLYRIGCGGLCATCQADRSCQSSCHTLPRYQASRLQHGTFCTTGPGVQYGFGHPSREGSGILHPAGLCAHLEDGVWHETCWRNWVNFSAAAIVATRSCAHLSAMLECIHLHRIFRSSFDAARQSQLTPARYKHTDDRR
jgi:hypothetical protein